MMERLLKNNTIVKVFAFFLAMMLWVYVTGDALRANIPEITRTFRNVPLSWLNLDERLEIMNIPVGIDVVLNGRADLINEITPENIRASVSLEGLSEGQHRIFPTAEVPRGVRVLSFVPQQVAVTLEEVESPQKPIVLEITGSPADGFVMGEPQILPGAVFVRGPRSLLARVEQARATVDVDGADGDRVLMVPVQAVDAAGQVINNLVVNPEMVEILIPFSKPQKTVPIRVPLSGEPAAGYVVRQVTITPATVTLEGAEEDLATISEAVTEPANIANATENIILELSLSQPAGGVSSLFAGKVQVEIVIQQQ
ncbi:MAG: CdaR family protein [Firmicutes bacterium]|nr:CdaR family protein [Bacillota bacterium]MCL5993013.1 CdaR family protein [Bacillota bacterium]